MSKMSKIHDFKVYCHLFKKKREYYELLEVINKRLSKTKVPEWIIITYVRLFDRFFYQCFTYEQAKECIGLDNVSMHLKEMRNHNILTVSLNKKDTRKRFYKLKK